MTRDDHLDTTKQLEDEVAAKAAEKAAKAAAKAAARATKPTGGGRKGKGRAKGKGKGKQAKKTAFPVWDDTDSEEAFFTEAETVTDSEVDELQASPVAARTMGQRPRRVERAPLANKQPNADVCAIPSSPVDVGPAVSDADAVAPAQIGNKIP